MTEIINRKFQDQAAGFIHHGPVEGFHRNELSKGLIWNVVPVGGDYITIQNPLTHTYARPAFEGENVPVILTPIIYKWRLIGVIGGWFHIKTTDGKHVWFLTGREDGAPVVLKPSSDIDEATQWAFEPPK